MSVDQGWPAETVAKLCALWDYRGPDGNLPGPNGRYFSTAEIGRRMERTKSAVVGKAHRLGLTPRESPIKREAAASRPVRPRRIRPKVSTLTALPSVVSHNAPRVERLPKALPTIATPAPPIERRAAAPCCFPFGQPGTRDFRFCGQPSKPGKPYCHECCNRAYLPAPPRRPDAAAA